MIMPANNGKDQNVLNNILWRVVQNQGGKIVMSYSDIKNMPASMGLTVDNIPGTDKIEINAVVNSKIMTPVKRIIT